MLAQTWVPNGVLSGHLQNVSDSNPAQLNLE